jgi:hypothetical protein
MVRCLSFASLLLLSAACASTPERVAPLAPLPDKVTSVPYADLLVRARRQADQANEAFFVNDWPALDEAAKGLEQTAVFLTKANDVPKKHSDSLVVLASGLGKLAKEVRDSAVMKDEKKTNEVMARLTAKVREMRLGD